ncbi:MAG: CoA transferase [Chloroflexota bacterium]|uniref:CoA transferase n=1 Tax=marine metagenome TaxID=408172 RepID=A0A381Q9E3_9ZZZZ|nr:CoA transferase [Chloroflexota bacterium]|tara:strand:+ start:221 stop:1498 length:1278 start_codon:yes stop_codon:yes gene_type:complete
MRGAQSGVPDGINFLLAPYRVLDLTDERGLLAGKILADLGADVVQIEPPGGNPARNIGPFYGDDPQPEKSLFWWAYAANKRSITLDLEQKDGQALLKKMVAEADFLVESFAPGYLDTLGLGYDVLAEINPKLVMVSITPFGQDGPYSNYQATDIVGMALGGFMYLTGDDDRAPVRISFPHFYLHGGAAGATAAMLAHTYRITSGQGQYVDVSCQQAVAKTLAHAPQIWDIEGAILKRMGVYRQTSGENRVRINWPCKDGYVNYMVQGGSVAYSTRALLEWMKEDSFDTADLDAIDWEKMGYGAITPELMSQLGEPLGDFFKGHTRAELVQGSLDRRILLFPVATPSALQDHSQLEARGYFKELEHPELGATVQYPGAFVKSGDGEDIAGIYRRPPLIGEHNTVIFQGELGITGSELESLKRSGVI